MRVLRIFHSAVVDAWRDRERALRQCGVDVRLVSSRVWNEGGTDVSLKPRPLEPVTGLRTWGRHPALFVYDPRGIWKAMGEPLDHIDIHEEPFALATAEILLIRRLRRNKATYSLYSAQNIDKRYPPPFRWLERLALRGASGVSVCNHEAGRIVERKGYPGRASYIPLGVDTATFAPRAVGSVAGDDRVRVGYVGRLEPHKGVDVLIDAVALDARIHLIVAGDGSASRALRMQVSRARLDDRVLFTGPVAHEDLPGTYRAVDVLAVPSVPTPDWTEQFCRVAVEAMACGVPVVASDTGALRDVVGEAGLLVPPGEPQLLATALVRAATSGPERDFLIEQGLTRARACSWPEVARSYRRLYELALHASGTQDREVEVIVVAYGRPDLLEGALEPLRPFPVTVVDNSSSSEVADVCTRLGVRYLDPGRNGGFAAGVNYALARRLRQGADVLLLNPDAVIEAGAVLTLHEALLADPSLASAAPSQVDDIGAPSKVSWPFPSPGRAWLTAVGLGRLPGRADFVIGSVLMLRAEALEQVGGFDETFFLYAEETDWAFRAHHLGWRHREMPGVRAVHLGAATSTDSRRRDSHFHASQERYLRKHYGAVGWQAARTATIVGALGRATVLRGARGRSARARASAYLTGPVKAERALAAADIAGASP